MQLDTVITEYLSSRAVDGFAANTIKNDHKVLRLFEAVAGAERPVDGLTAVDMDKYFASRRAAGVAPSTLNVDLSSLKAFIKWCQVRGYAPDRDPLAGKRWHKVNRPLKLFVPVEDFPRILQTADHPVDRMIIATGLYLFTRASESTTLRVGDVDLHEGFIDVTVIKTSERDRMPISAEYGAELRRYFGWYAREVGALSADLFLHPRKQPRNNRYCPGEYNILTDKPITRLADLINCVLVKAGYPAESGSREGGHTLRRSGALALYRELSEVRGHDGSIRIVSTMLHHANISTTEDYLDLRLDRVTRNKLLRGQPMFSVNSPAGRLKVV